MDALPRYRKLLAAKIHRATVTAADVNYEGSLTVPPELLVAAGIVAYESLHVWNVTRGSRLETYAIEVCRGLTIYVPTVPPPTSFAPVIM